LLEGKQDAPSDLGRVFDPLQARCKGLPIVVAEIGVTRAGSEDEIVVAHTPSTLDQDLACHDVDPFDGAEHDRDVAVPPDDAADGRGDVCRGQACRRHLIEQRLEKVIVLAVDDDDLNRGVGERFSCP
jgi:hypothetical protein